MSDSEDSQQTEWLKNRHSLKPAQIEFLEKISKQYQTQIDHVYHIYAGAHFNNATTEEQLHILNQKQTQHQDETDWDTVDNGKIRRQSKARSRNMRHDNDLQNFQSKPKSNYHNNNYRNKRDSRYEGGRKSNDDYQDPAYNDQPRQNQRPRYNNYQNRSGEYYGYNKQPYSYDYNYNYQKGTRPYGNYNRQQHNYPREKLEYVAKDQLEQPTQNVEQYQEEAPKEHNHPHQTQSPKASALETPIDQGEETKKKQSSPQGARQKQTPEPSTSAEQHSQRANQQQHSTSQQQSQQHSEQPTSQQPQGQAGQGQHTQQQSQEHKQPAEQKSSEQSQKQHSQDQKPPQQSKNTYQQQHQVPYSGHGLQGQPYPQDQPLYSIAPAYNYYGPDPQFMYRNMQTPGYFQNHYYNPFPTLVYFIAFPNQGATIPQFIPLTEENLQATYSYLENFIQNNQGQ